VGTESAVCNPDTFGLDRVCEGFENWDGLLGPCSSGEGGAATFANVGEKCELRHDEDGAPDVGDAPVHLGIRVGEDAHADGLGCGDTRIGFGISLCDAHEGKEAGADQSGGLPVDLDCRSADSLQDDAHRTFLVDSECTVHRWRKPTPTLAAVIREIPWSLFRGFLMGAADIVPGVSGGTIALVLGMYERLIASVRAGSSALGAFLRLDFSGGVAWLRRIDWAFILPLGAGIGLAVITLAHLLERLLHDHAVLMAALFLGLVAGSAVIAWKLLTVRDMRRVAVIAGVALTVFVLLGLNESTSSETAAQISDPTTWAFFGSGAIAICAMILPGISGSFILVMLGMYGPLLSAVTSRDFGSLIVFMIGAVIGLALFSQVLHRALRDYYNTVMAALIGLMLGSLRVLWPWPLGVDSTAIHAPGSDALAALAVAVFAFALVLGIEILGRTIGHHSVEDEVDELTAE
jgi:putative membrane protein